MRAWALVLAVLVAAPVAAQEAPTVIFVQEKNPAAAGLFSVLIPGGGQFYNGQKGKGIAFLGVGVLAVAIAASNSCTEELIGGEWVETSCENDGTMTGGLIYLANSLVSVIYAVETAQRLNAEARARVQPTVSRDGRVGLAVSVPF